MTDVNVAGEAGSVRTLAMRTTEWSGGEGRWLVTLFDVTGRARLYEHEHRLVESLQRSLLLERMPAVDTVSLAARYVPGEGEVRVGGDWYDAILLPDGRLGVDRLDHLLHHLEPGGMATMVYLSYEPATRNLRFAAAGHPYPLLAGPDGETEFLEGGRSLPLGTGVQLERPEAEVVLGSGATLILYTDGLIERRSQHSLDEGFARLAASASRYADDPDAQCELILSELLGDEPPMDDVALLVMRTAP